MKSIRMLELVGNLGGFIGKFKAFIHTIRLGMKILLEETIMLDFLVGKVFNKLIWKFLVKRNLRVLQGLLMKVLYIK